MTGIDKRFILKIPSSAGRMDGTPHSFDAVPEAVEAGDVAKFVNSG